MKSWNPLWNPEIQSKMTQDTIKILHVYPHTLNWLHLHGRERILYDVIAQCTTMTFVPNRFSVGYKGHFPRWRMQYVMHVFIHHMQAPGPAQKSKSTLKSRNPLWNRNPREIQWISNLMRRDTPWRTPRKNSNIYTKALSELIDQSLLIIAKFVDTRVRHIFNLVHTNSS